MVHSIRCLGENFLPSFLCLLPNSQLCAVHGVFDALCQSIEKSSVIGCSARSVFHQLNVLYSLQVDLVVCKKCNRIVTNVEDDLADVVILKDTAKLFAVGRTGFECLNAEFVDVDEVDLFAVCVLGDVAFIEKECEDRDCVAAGEVVSFQVNVEERLCRLCLVNEVDAIQKLCNLCWSVNDVNTDACCSHDE